MADVKEVSLSAASSTGGQSFSLENFTKNQTFGDNLDDAMLKRKLRAYAKKRAFYMSKLQVKIEGQNMAQREQRAKRF